MPRTTPKPWNVVGSLMGLTVAAVLLAALVGYDQADRAAGYVYPANPTVHNWCGSWGAEVSARLLETLGIVAYGTIFIPLFVGWTYLRQTTTLVFCRQLFGLFLLLSAAATLAASLAIPGTILSVYGAGGWVGLLAVRVTESTLGLLGCRLSFTSLLLIGWVLLADGHLLWPWSTCFRAWRDWQERQALAKVTAAMLALEMNPTALTPGENQGEEPQLAASEVKTPASGAVPIVRPAPATKSSPVVPLTISLGSSSNLSNFQLPALELLEDPPPPENVDREEEIRERAQLLEKTFAEFQMKVKVVQIHTGPVVTQYEIELEPGLRLSKVTGMSGDLAVALRVQTVRIVAPIPGKNTVGIEVPNYRRTKVVLKEVMTETAPAVASMRLPMFLGKDVKGRPLVCDLATMPHLLIAGRTGTGKSVCLNTLILSVLMTRTPEQVKMLMIDPKMVELSLYRDIPHLLHPVVTDMQKAEALLAWAVEKMEERYSLLSRVGVRHVDSFNKLSREEILARYKPSDDLEAEELPDKLPYILIFADEMADLMMTAAKEVEAHIIRLAQKSRAVGIHLILATQKPTVDVITGLIKSNLPARIAFQVASRTDSRVVLDEMGADKLLGNGDMLFLYPGTSTLIRAQGTFVSDDEVTRMTQYLATQAAPQYAKELLQLDAGPKTGMAPSGGIQGSDRDDLYEQAVDVVIREQRGSTSLLQRALGVGYGRAAKLIDYMADDGIVGGFNGSQAREVLFTLEQWEQVRQNRRAG